MLEAKLKFFDINKCGFYRRAGVVPEFGGISDILDNLVTWASDGREFVNTTTYQRDPDNDLLDTYFYSSSNSSAHSDRVVVLWNESPNDNGTLYGINPMDRPGASTSMLSTDFGGVPAIPGAPSYFWFIPERKVFASIRFDHSISGKSNLDHYLNGFLSNKSPQRVVNEADDVIGFTADGRPHDDAPTIYPKFLARAKKQEELESELLANLHKIRKIIKRETLSYQTLDDRPFFERVFSELLDNTPSFIDLRTITHELQYQPSEAELRAIIHNYHNKDSDSSIRNTGFVYNDGKVVMLNGMNIQQSIELNVDRYENHIVAPADLLTAITANRAQYLSILGSNADETSSND